MSLPYADPPSDRRVADALILEELQKGGGARKLVDTDVVASERKVDLGRIDQARYALSVPASGDQSAWDAASENALAQLEHQQNRLLNLDLLQKHGPDAWQKHNEVLSSIVDALESDVKRMRGDIEALNQGRKMDQLRCREACAKFEAARAEAEASNEAMRSACAELEQRAETLKTQVGSLKEVGSV